MEAAEALAGAPSIDHDSSGEPSQARYVKKEEIVEVVGGHRFRVTDFTDGSFQITAVR